MATTKTKARRPAARKKTTSKGSRGQASLDRVDKSLDAAQKALADLQKGLSHGGREVLKDLQKMVGDARGETRRLNKSVRAELEEVGSAISRRTKAVRKRSGTSKRATSKKATRRPAARKGTSKARASKKATTKRSTSKRSA